MSTHITKGENGTRFIIHDGCTYVDTLRTRDQMRARNEIQEQFHHDKAHTETRTLWRVWHIQLRNNASKRMKSWA